MGRGGQQVIRMRSASVKNEKKKNSGADKRDIIHNESESLSAGGSLLRVVWKSPDNDDYISAAVTKTPF